MKTYNELYMFILTVIWQELLAEVIIIITVLDYVRFRHEITLVDMPIAIDIPSRRPITYSTELDLSSFIYGI